MIASNIALSLVFATANAGTSLGVDATHFDQFVRSSDAEPKKRIAALDDADVDVSKRAGLRGFDGVASRLRGRRPAALLDWLAEIGSNRADLTAPAEKIERSSRLVGVSTEVS